jgi:hypothetical protein
MTSPAVAVATIGRGQNLSRNGLYALVAILIVVIAAVGFYAYEQSQRPGLEVKIDSNGLQVNGNGG